jgi:hypothetical protein
MTFTRAVRRAAWRALAAALAIPVACTRDVVVGEDRAAIADTATGGRTHAGGSSGNGGEDAASACREARCQNHLYECGDCIDNDGDGLVDMDDPDCLGPCQNSEQSFNGNIPGQNNGNCVQDCYFDQDSGSGNDDCVWSHACDSLSVAPDYPPQGQACAYDPNTRVRPGNANDCAILEQTQSALCISVCGPLTPNGCDCFGCCHVPGAPTPIWLGSVDAAGIASCDRAHLADPTRCRPCTQVSGCLNPCDICELCVGKATLPPECGTGCASPECPAGQTPCGTPCLPACQNGTTCITGCCVPGPH